MKFDWKQLSVIGTEEWLIPDVLKEPWTFPAFEKALSEGGIFEEELKAEKSKGTSLYVFLQTEAHFMNDLGKMVLIPVLCVFRSRVPAPALVGHDSVQSTKAAERSYNIFGSRPIPMSAADVRMDWVPWEGIFGSSVVGRRAAKRGKGAAAAPRVFGLMSLARKVQRKNLNEMQAHYKNYLNPYIVLPQHMDGKEMPQVTNATFVWEWEGKKYDLNFDKEVEVLSEFVPATLEDINVEETEEAAASLKQAVKDAFAKARESVKEQWDEVQGMISKLSPEEATALRESQLYKFYPTHPIYDIHDCRATRINRYYQHCPEENIYGAEPMSEEEKQAYFDKLKEEQESDEEMVEEKKAEEEPKAEADGEEKKDNIELFKEEEEKEPKKKAPKRKTATRKKPAAKKAAATTKKAAAASKKTRKSLKVDDDEKELAAKACKRRRCK